MGIPVSGIRLVIQDFAKFKSNLNETQAIYSSTGKEAQKLSETVNKLGRDLKTVSDAAKRTAQPDMFQRLTKGYVSRRDIKTISDFMRSSSSLMGQTRKFGEYSGGVLTNLTNVARGFMGLPPIVNKTTKSMKQAGQTAQQSGAQIGGLSAGTQQASQGLSILDIAIGSTIGNLATGLVGAVTSAGASLVNYGIEATKVAAQADQMRISAQYVGGTVGMTADQVDKQIESVKGLGIRYDVAAQSVIDMAEAQLDMSKTAELVRIAQASGIKTGQDSSATLQNLIYGIRTMQPEVLRTAGIVLTLDEAQRIYAKETGKSVQSLTAMEKQQAMYNGVLAKGAGLLKLYDVAMQEPAKRLASMDRLTYELQRQMGVPFKGAFSSVVDIMENTTKTLIKATAEGGALYSTLTKVGAGVSVVFSGIASFSEQGLNALITALGDTTTTLEAAGQQTGRFAEQANQSFIVVQEGFITRLSNTASEAVGWGANIITNLATGIIDAATTVLSTAMDFIGSILSSWLAPGSPPKVAPDLEKWGINTMAVYLKGFTEADYDILGNITQPLESVLSIMGRGAEMPQFKLDISKAVSAGNMDEVFKKIAGTGGVLGDELTKLVKLQWDLSKATEAATKAETDFNTSQDKVTTLTKEYNDMLRKGASKDALKAKLAEINAAEKLRDQAGKDMQAAQGKVEPLQKQVSLQDKLMSQLLDMAKTQDQIAKEAAEAARRADAERAKKAGGKAGKAGEELQMPDLKVPQIGALVNKEMDTAVANMKAKISGMFAPLQAKFGESFGKMFSTLTPQFQSLSNQVTQTVTTLKTKFTAWWTTNGPTITVAVNRIKTSVENLIGAVGNMVKEVIAKVGPFIGETLAKITQWTVDNGPLIAKFANVVSVVAATVVDAIANKVLPEVAKMWAFIEPILSGIINLILGVAKTLMQIATGDWAGAWATIKQTVSNAWTAIILAINNFANWVAGWFGTTWAGIINVWFENWKMAGQIVLGVLSNIVTWFVEKIQGIVQPIITGFINNFLTPIVNTFVSIREKVQWVIDTLTRFGAVISGLAPTLPSWLTPGSPTPLEESLWGVGSATDTMTNSFLQFSLVAENEVNRVLGGPAGTIYDLEYVGNLAASSKGKIADPLEESFFRIRDAAAEAGSAVGGVASGLEDIKAMNNLKVEIWVITHEQTIHEPDINRSGGGGGGGPRGRQHGGDVFSRIPYIVGERGPEVFVPNTAGKIIPNQAVPAAPMVGNTVNINFGGVTVVGGVGAAVLASQIKRAVVAGLKR